MSKFFLKVVILMVSFSAMAKMQTEFKWIKSPEKFHQGVCYEIDSDSQGQKYKVKTDAFHCRPEKFLYYFLPSTGKCYEVDELTNGKNYANQCALENCQPDQTQKIFAKFLGKDACYLVDAKTSGHEFFKYIDQKECNESNTLYFFKLEKNHQGNCYTQAENTLVKVNLKFCQPESPIYRFYRTGLYKGDCFEQDPRGEQYYSQKINIEKCKPTQTVYIFYTNPETKRGECFEIDEISKGDIYINTVKPHFCKE